MKISSFSFILPVYGLNKFHFIKKLIDSIYSFKRIKKEIIIKDQNKLIDLKLFLNSNYKSKNNFLIKYFKSKRGLSLSRNIGIKNSTGQVICFPDDDCEYPNDTLNNVLKFFKKNDKYKVLITKVIETKKKYTLRFTSKKNSSEINYSDIFKNCCSISIFHINDLNLYFDENLGLGSKYRSCEDYDYVLRIKKLGYRVFFDENISVFHPDSNKLENKKIIEKVENNSIGHGVYFRKHFNILYIQSFYYIIGSLIGSFYYILIGNIFKSKLYYITFKNRIKGFLIFKN